MKCKLCSGDTTRFAQARMLWKHLVAYFHCNRCGFVQTEEPYWLEEAYQNPINVYDTGILSRNHRLSQQVAAVIYFLFDKEARFLDYAGGYGIFTRLMRDIGFDFYWDDPHTQNLLARGFEYSGPDGDIELVTAFECIEHFVDPLAEFERLLSLSSSILLSTEPIADNPPPPEEWWYYALGHGQHVSFYSEKTLRFLADKFSLNYYGAGTNLFLLSSKQFNPKLFRWLVRKHHKWALSRWVAKRMKSRIVSDMNSLLRSQN